MPTHSPISPPIGRPWIATWGPGLLLLIGVATFANSVRDGEFIFDDQMWMEQLTALPSIWSESFWLQGNEGPQHGRPLVAASLALNYCVSGDDLAGYRAFNLTMHLATAITLFALLRLILQSQSLPPSIRAAAVPLAWVSAAIWMVHPLQTECVNYISQRSEILSSLALLLTLYCALRSRPAGPERLGWMLLAIAASWFGAGCKETAALAPLLVIVVEFATGTSPLRTLLRNRWPFFLALATVWIPVVTLIALAPRTETVGVGEKAGVLKYLLNQCLIIPDYFKLAFWPAGLAIDYGEPVSVTLLQAAPGAVLIVVLLAFGTVWLVRRPPLGLAVWWVFLTLAPTSSFIPIQTEVGAERRMYLPLAAIVVASISLGYLGMRKLAGRLSSERLSSEPLGARLSAKRSRLAVVAGIALLLTLLSVRTQARNAEYRDVIGLWQSSFEARPNNPRAIYNLGVRLSKLGQMQGAIAAYRLTIKIDPNYVTAHNNLGISLRQLGDYQGARHHFQTAATRYKNWTLALNNLARLYAACPDAEFRDGDEAVRIAEAICLSHPNQAPYLETLAAAYAEQGNFELAIERLQEARQLEPAGSAPDGGRFEKLIEQFRRGEPFRFPAPQEKLMVRHQKEAPKRQRRGDETL